MKLFIFLLVIAYSRGCINPGAVDWTISGDAIYYVNKSNCLICTEFPCSPMPRGGYIISKGWADIQNITSRICYTLHEKCIITPRLYVTSNFEPYTQTVIAELYSSGELLSSVTVAALTPGTYNYWREIIYVDPGVINFIETHTIAGR